VGVVVDQRPDRGKFDVVRGLKERLTAMERMNLETFGPHGHDLIADLNNVGKAYLIEPFG
jgi:hypothetical protein